MSRIVIVLLIGGFLSGSFSLFAQEKVEWLTFEEAIEKLEQQKRKIFVEIYTDWCGNCKRMDRETFKDPEIAQYLNENFYPVKFNAMYKEEITYNGKKFQFVKNGNRGYHELAAELVEPLGRIELPTIVFIDSDLSLLQPIPGFQPPSTFEIIMTYFGEDHYKDTPWKQYSTNYSSNEN